MSKRTRGLTLIETLILGGIVLLISILVLPLVNGARIAANENEAVDVLRVLHKHHGALQEQKPGRPPALSGVTTPLLQTHPDCTVTRLPDAGESLLRYHGYLLSACTDQEGKGLNGSFYAWPAEVEVSGTAAFFINPEGQVFFTHNLQKRYSGITIRPHPDAALPRSGKMPVLPSKVRRPNHRKKDSGGYIGNDNQRWSLLQA